MSLPALNTKCGQGFGLAVCRSLGLVVTSNVDDNSLSVFALPDTSALDSALLIGGPASIAGGLQLIATLGATSGMHFTFDDTHGYSGGLAFVERPGTRAVAPARCPLLVTDAGNDAVHVIDVVARVHMGYVASQGAIVGPRSVAAHGRHAAVSAWRYGHHGVVHMFEGSGADWTRTRTIICTGLGGRGGSSGSGWQLSMPMGLRFSRDGTGLVVADPCDGLLALFRVVDGSLIRPLARIEDPWDVEECAQGWLVTCSACGSDTVERASGLSAGPRGMDPVGMSCPAPPPSPWCRAWGCWCGSGAVSRCGCWPWRTMWPWRPCPHTEWGGWWRRCGLCLCRSFLAGALSAKSCILFREESGLWVSLFRPNVTQESRHSPRGHTGASLLVHNTAPLDSENQQHLLNSFNRECEKRASRRATQVGDFKPQKETASKSHGDKKSAGCAYEEEGGRYSRKGGAGAQCVASRWANGNVICRMEWIGGCGGVGEVGSHRHVQRRKGMRSATLYAEFASDGSDRTLTLDTEHDSNRLYGLPLSMCRSMSP